MKRGLAFLAAVLVSACGSDPADAPDAGAGMFVITGRVPAAGEARSAGLRSNLPGLDGATVDRVVAIPHYRGRVDRDSLQDAVTAPIPADGAFQLTLQPGRDWVLLLEQTTAPKTQRVRAYVTFQDLAASGSLVTLPAANARANLDLGALRGQGSEAVAATPPAEVAQVFQLTQQTLADMARADDAYTQIVNAWINYDPAAGRRYLVSSFVLWTDSFENLVADAQDPSRYTFYGYSFTLSAVDPSLDYAALCAGTQTLRIVPPEDVILTNGEVIGPTAPLENAAMAPGGGGGCSGGYLQLDQLADGGEIRISAPGNGFGNARVWLAHVPTGWWRVELDGETVAEFDPQVSPAIDDAGRPTGVVPRLHPTSAGDGTLASLDVDWLTWHAESGTWAPADHDALNAVFYQSLVHLFGRAETLGQPEPRETFGSTDPASDHVIEAAQPAPGAWFLGMPYAAPAGAETAYVLDVTWEVGPVQNTLFVQRQCWDYDWDGLSGCDGDPDEQTPLAESFCHLETTDGAPIVEGDRTLYPIAANLEGTWELYAFCSFVPGPRPWAAYGYQIRGGTGAEVLVEERSTGELASPIVAATLNLLGPGDYRLDVTAYDAVGGESAPVVVYLRVQPFEERFGPLTLAATLAGSALTIHSSYALEFRAWPEDPAAAVAALVDDSTLRKLAGLGCETALTAADDCGGCGYGCGSQTCDAGICTTLTPGCEWFMQDCDGDPATGTLGCEVDRRSDPENCGGCGRVCPADRVCVQGFCVLACGPATGDCNGDAGDLCEQETLASVTQCGSCGHMCAAGEICAAGFCRSADSRCLPGSADCDLDPQSGLSGCETVVASAPGHCGACGHACALDEVCIGGRCQRACPADRADCDGSDATGFTPPDMTFGGSNRTFVLTWPGPPPVQVGDWIELRAGTLKLANVTIPQLCSDSFDDAPPCMESLPPIGARIVSGP